MRKLKVVLLSTLILFGLVSFFQPKEASAFFDVWSIEEPIYNGNGEVIGYACLWCDTNGSCLTLQCKRWNEQ